MRFFDYKFLILLGLTLVVYFIYREVEFLRNKIEKLENKNNTIEEKPTIELSNKYPILSLPAKKDNETKKISVDLTPTATQCNANIGVQIIQQKINEIIENSDNELSTTTNVSESESSKHLAIYSNDNEHFDETQNSLLESVEANKNDQKFDYNRMEIPNLKDKMENIINDLSSEAPEKKSPIDEIIEEKEKQLSEMKSSPTKTTELDESTLNNMKLQDLKKIAEKHKITFTKKINGQQKSKNKNELITEILNKLK